MHGNDRVRFCDHCTKHVNDLSAMTRKDAMKIVREANGRLCVRYLEHPQTKAPIFADSLVHISRRAPSLAAGVVGASLALSSATYAQGGTNGSVRSVGEKVVADRDAGEKKEGEAKPTAILKGTVTDSNGAVVAGAVVRATLEDAETSRSATTDAEGNYHLYSLEIGRYSVTVESPGFRKATTIVHISQKGERTFNTTLDVGAIMGAIVVTVALENSLAVAVENDDIDAVYEEIAKGAKVNFKEKGNDDVTPLFLAVENGNVEIARLLLNYGAKVNARDAQRRTPLMRIDSESDIEMVDLLLQFGAKVDLEDKEGNTALMAAAEESDAKVVEALIKAGADVNAANEEGWTALMFAADDDDVEKVRLLLNAGAEINAKNKEDENAWDLTSDAEVEALLVSFGAEVKEEAEEEIVEEPNDT